MHPSFTAIFAFGFSVACGGATTGVDRTGTSTPASLDSGSGATPEPEPARPSPSPVEPSDAPSGAESDAARSSDACVRAVGDGTCAMSEQLTLSDPTVRDDDGDDKVEPGETVTIGVVLSNPGPLDHFWYPGIEITADHPGYDSHDSFLYGLFAGTSFALSVRYQVPADALRHDVITFQVSATSINIDQPCCGLASLRIPVLVE